MIEKRKHTRYQALAKVLIKGKGISDEEVLLKDISITGCRIELPANLTIEPNTHYKLKIIPESEAEIESFLLDVEPRWLGAEHSSSEIGFSITKSPKGKQFQRYVDYLSWRYSHGNSMTKDKDVDIIVPLI